MASFCQPMEPIEFKSWPAQATVRPAAKRLGHCCINLIPGKDFVRCNMKRMSYSTIVTYQPNKSFGKIVGMGGTVQYELGRRVVPGDRTTPTLGQTLVLDGTAAGRSMYGNAVFRPKVPGFSALSPAEAIEGLRFLLPSAASAQLLGCLRRCDCQGAGACTDMSPQTRSLHALRMTTSARSLLLRQRAAYDRLRHE